MGLLVRVSKTLLADMGVNLGSRQAAMPQQLLDAAEVGPAIQKVCGEAVTKRVGAGRRVEVVRFQVLLE
jgi:hypothetical protein